MTTSQTGRLLSERNTIASVNCTDEQLTAKLGDGREISAPLAWYPRLAHASQAARGNWLGADTGSTGLILMRISALRCYSTGRLRLKPVRLLSDMLR